MNKYLVFDGSHHKGIITPSLFPAQGVRHVMYKASDNYHMPDKEGKFDFAADRHHDSRFAENYDKSREAGLIVSSFHFARFDRPIGTLANIVEKNLEYYQIATTGRGSLITPGGGTGGRGAVVDIEQSPAQLIAAGLTPATITDMAKDIIRLFLDAYNNVNIYTGSWWFNDWITDPEWFSERCMLHEAEYKILNPITKQSPLNPNAQPTVANGWKLDWATRADDAKNKLFAWQFTSHGRLAGVNGDADLNFTEMPKAEIAKIYGQEIAVDPPMPPDVSDHADVIEVLDELDEFSANKREQYQ